MIPSVNEIAIASNPCLGNFESDAADGDFFHILESVVKVFDVAFFYHVTIPEAVRKDSPAVNRSPFLKLEIKRVSHKLVGDEGVAPSPVQCE